MIFIGACVAASHFVYYILRLPFDGQFHIVQSDIGNDIIYNVSRLFLENPPPPNFIALRKDSPPPRHILFILIFIGARVAANHIVFELDIRNDIIYNVSRLFLEIPPTPNFNHLERIRRDTFCL